MSDPTDPALSKVRLEIEVLEQELELKKKEINLKQRELDLKDKETQASSKPTGFKLDPVIVGIIAAFLSFAGS
jgi:hypothetical protein